MYLIRLAESCITNGLYFEYNTKYLGMIYSFIIYYVVKTARTLRYSLILLLILMYSFVLSNKTNTFFYSFLTIDGKSMLTGISVWDSQNMYVELAGIHVLGTPTTGIEGLYTQPTVPLIVSASSRLIFFLN